MQNLVKDSFLDESNTKTSSSIPSTKFSEEIVSKDAERFFREIVKNTQSEPGVVLTGKEKKEEEK